MIWNQLSIKEKFNKKKRQKIISFLHFTLFCPSPLYFFLYCYPPFLSTLSSSSSFLLLFYLLSSAVLSWAFSLFSASFFSMVIIKQSAVWHFIVCVCAHADTSACVSVTAETLFSATLYHHKPYNFLHTENINVCHSPRLCV